jgi:hypothetical protein
MFIAVLHGNVCDSADGVDCCAGDVDCCANAINIAALVTFMRLANASQHCTGEGDCTTGDFHCSEFYM